MAKHFEKSRPLPVLSRGVLIAVISHAGFGLYVVFTKDLFARFPPFALLACAFGFSLLFGSIILHREFQWPDVLKGGVWLVAIVALMRSFTKMVAVQYTLATYVQLLSLMSPFFTAVLSRIFLHEKLPEGTIPALLISTFGAFLVIVRNPFAMALPNGSADLIGLLLATASAMFMAVLVVITNFSTRHRSNPVNVYLQQTFTLVVAYLILSFASGESWAPLWQAGIPEMAYLLLFFVIVFLSGGSAVFAMARVNTAFFSTLLSLRLVVAILAGWIILGERFTSWYQALGAALVIIAITWYLWRSKARDAQRVGVSSEPPHNRSTT